MQSLTMNNTMQIPQIGFGTWQINEGREAYESVRYAFEVGYRHIDTASAYENEESVGRAIKESGINREDIFLTTKLHNNDHGYERTRNAFLESLKKLDSGYVDLYLIHWPNPIASRSHWQEANRESWKAMEEFVSEGLIKSIGISNFREHHIESLLERAQIKPQVNQIRLYAGEQQQKLVRYCRDKQMVLEAYSPLGTGALLTSDLVRSIAGEVGKSPAQVCLRYNIQKGHVVLPKSVTPASIEQNIDIFDFSLNKQQMKLLDEMENICGGTQNPDETSF
ncbi:MAG: aldo/keto reductase [Sphaerochaeta sp.]